MSMMDPTLKAEWLTALRSGEYKQVEGYLKREREDGEVGYCCLGVLCDVIAKRGEFGPGLTLDWADADPIDDEPHFTLQVVAKDGRVLDTMAGSLPFQVENFFDVTTSILGAEAEEFDPIVYKAADGVDAEAYSLIELNDVAGMTFEQIANVIEERI